MLAYAGSRPSSLLRLIVVKGPESGPRLVTVSYAGSQVSGDPSATELELGEEPVTGADLVAVAADPRLEFTMTGDVLRAGEELTGWSE